MITLFIFVHLKKNLGYPTDSDPSTWTEFVEAQKTHFLKTFNDFQRELNRLFNYEPPEGEEVEAFVVRSKWLNIYQYPEVSEVVN